MDNFSWSKELWVLSLHFRNSHQSEPGWIGHVLNLAVKLAAQGLPVPWLGFLADLWKLISIDEAFARPEIIDPTLASHPSFVDYQDLVIARCIQDAGIIRVRRAVASRSVERKTGALLFLLESWHDSGLPLGVPVSVGSIAILTGELPRREASAKEITEKNGWPDELVQAVKSFSQGFRKLPASIDLGVVDVVEKGLDIVDHAPRIQLRQIAAAKNRLNSVINKLTSHLSKLESDVSTSEFDSGNVPLGGYSSISTRGRLESLLPSQLAWLDISIGQSNYFCLKHRRQELLYYSRSENSLYKRMRHIVFLLDKSLDEGRTKYRNLPCQSLTLMMAGLLCLWEQMKSIFCSEGITLTLVFMDTGYELENEKKLLELLFSSEIVAGKVRTDRFEVGRIPSWLKKTKSEPGLIQVALFVGKQWVQPENDETFGYPGIILKDQDLVSMDGWIPGQPNIPVWPDAWAANIRHLVEILAAY